MIRPLIFNLYEITQGGPDIAKVGSPFLSIIMLDTISKLKQSWPSYYADCLLVECRIEGGNVCVIDCK